LIPITPSCKAIGTNCAEHPNTEEQLERLRYAHVLTAPTPQARAAELCQLLSLITGADLPTDYSRFEKAQGFITLFALQ
jgi:hypothetical protein